jgi:hypothetical protein
VARDRQVDVVVVVQQDAARRHADLVLACAAEHAHRVVAGQQVADQLELRRAVGLRARPWREPTAREVDGEAVGAERAVHVHGVDAGGRRRAEGVARGVRSTMSVPTLVTVRSPPRPVQALSVVPSTWHHGASASVSAARTGVTQVRPRASVQVTRASACEAPFGRERVSTTPR